VTISFSNNILHREVSKNYNGRSTQDLRPIQEMNCLVSENKQRKRCFLFPIRGICILLYISRINSMLSQIFNFIPSSLLQVTAFASHEVRV